MKVKNPTINYGSIVLMRVTGVKGDNDYTMSVPLAVLGILAGDFDGDGVCCFFETIIQ